MRAMWSAPHTPDTPSAARSGAGRRRSDSGPRGSCRAARARRTTGSPATSRSLRQFILLMSLTAPHDLSARRLRPSAGRRAGWTSSSSRSPANRRPSVARERACEPVPRAGRAARAGGRRPPAPGRRLCVGAARAPCAPAPPRAGTRRAGDPRRRSSPHRWRPRLVGAEAGAGVQRFHQQVSAQLRQSAAPACRRCPRARSAPRPPGAPARRPARPVGRMMLTPVTGSPASIARSTGAAPRQRGSSEGCTLASRSRTAAAP